MLDLIAFLFSLYLLGPIRCVFSMGILASVVVPILFMLVAVAANSYFRHSGYAHPKRAAALFCLALYGIASAILGTFFLAFAMNLH